MSQLFRVACRCFLTLLPLPALLLARPVYAAAGEPGTPSLEFIENKGQWDGRVRYEAALPAGGPRAATPAEHLAQDVAKVDALVALALVLIAAAWASAAGPAGMGAPRSGPAAAAKAARGLAAIGVDLAGVELLAFGNISQDVEGRADPLEAFFGFLVVRVGVRMVGLRELAERLADFVRACAAGDAQDLIGVARQVRQLPRKIAL